METRRHRVKFNVGGKIFETTATTLASAGRDSLLGAMLDDNWNLKSNNMNEYFIDRNPECFSVLLDLLRTGELHIPANVPEKLLYKEAHYYRLHEHVRIAKRGNFDGNNLSLAGSITSKGTGHRGLIRASPDSGCCVARDRIVHVYDWMLEGYSPINLDYEIVNDMGWIDSNNIVICVGDKAYGGNGGIGLFSSTTGDLKHKFEVIHENQIGSFTAGAMSFDSDCCKIYACCKGRGEQYMRSKENGIGVWDIVTGKQVDFFYEGSAHIGDANKLQWLNGSKCLLVGRENPNHKKGYSISIIDFREKKWVMSWYHENACDVIAMEDTNSILVADYWKNLSFMDMRRTGEREKWSGHTEKVYRDTCYPITKLEYHGNQIFLSSDGYISVFCGPKWALTSELQNSHASKIIDFSIGGDRLFALHLPNTIDVWEAPSLPTI